MIKELWDLRRKINAQEVSRNVEQTSEIVLDEEEKEETPVT